MGSEPFLIKCKNGGVVLEIPEIRVGKVLKHVKECEENKKLCLK